jgi:prepilin-type N-terminal cleavage/methylation domain-containing protein
MIKRFLSSLASLAHSAAGFTMIELLVVIAVIGVLAVAVLSSIDPIEQINKGRDTRKRSNAAQLINAIDRFYAIQEKYPWNESTYATELSADTDPDLAFPEGTACTDNGNGFCQIGGAGYTTANWLTALSQTSEVKESFINQLSDTSSTNELFVFKRLNAAGADDSVYTCFEPASKQFQLEAIDGCVDRQALLPPGACTQSSYTSSTVYVDEMICLP